MQRRDFVKKTSLLTLGLSLGFSNIKKLYSEGKPLNIFNTAPVSDELETTVGELFEWMRTNGWAAHLQQTLGINLNLTGNDLKKELLKEINADKLTALRRNEQSGYDDFSGERLVQPGFPAYSLLFHSLASPRVRPKGIKEYPTLSQIDVLENYIYALSDLDLLKTMYRINSNEELVLAVFAYEYRPAFKTPHHAYADMVYSRTGIARIGNEPLNYDKLNRCHTSKPADETRYKNVAVMPARYGLFIARKVQYEYLSLVKSEQHKGSDLKDDRSDSAKFFLQPIRKVFNEDMLVDNSKIQFSEMHKSEKLEKLSLSKGIKMKDQKPKPRFSKDLVVQDDDIRNAGSSFLVISQKNDLIRPAREDGRILFFKVPEYGDEPFANRYFTALCTQEVEDVELLTGDNSNLQRIYNRYPAPRNQPLFVNITNKVKDDTTYQPIPKTKTRQFEKFIDDGNYYAPLFEDSICDGSVIADTAALNLGKLSGISKKCLPAFSIVTAPDFFPQVDPLDFELYDIDPGLDTESHFYEGGVASLATARIKPNPKMIDTGSDNTSDTYLAVISASVKKKTGISQSRLPEFRDPASDRGYEISGFLPDVASSVFAPGWDVTYCGIKNDIYIGTEGLGSPFIEDMKFCAALNGMWPATSPDAARTYQGSNEPDYRNPTAVPLLDHEIGICAKGPAGKEYESFGWDGEQGPYLEEIGNKWKINFTDLGRADAVGNALNGRLDMSVLRKLKSAELINRMECLKMCIHNLPKRNFRKEFTSNITGYTYLWLISAEKVNWGKEHAPALGVPSNLVGNNKDWISRKENAKVQGEGYLYVFANSVADHIGPKDWADDLKRRRLDVDGEEIYVCQVTTDANSTNKIAWTKVKKNGSINWQVK